MVVTALDQAISAYVAHTAGSVSDGHGPVIAWVTIAVTDDDGDEEPWFIIAVPPGQRGFITRGVLLDALDAARITEP